MAFKGIVAASNYAFNAASKTITFSNDYLGMALSDITYITNIKDGVATVIYDPFDATKGGVLNGLTLTLSFNTTTMSNSDPLQIIVGFTPVNADPLLVKPVDTNSTVDQTQLLQNISDNLDFLNLSLDQSEGIEVNVREKNPYKKDSENALILSDTFETKYIIPTSTTVVSPAIDTKGYQSIQWSTIGGTSWSNVSIQFSNDGNNWIGGYYYYQLGGSGSLTWGTGLSSSGGCLFYCPVQGRYARLSIFNSSGSVPIPMSILLRTAPFAHPTGLSTAASVNTSLNFVAASTIAGTATQGYNALLTWNNTISVAGNTQPGATSIPYPIITGGITPPATGSLAGVARSLILDSAGRTVLGTDNAFLNTPTLGSTKESLSAGTTRGVGGVPNNIVGMQSLTVTDAAQDFGDTQVMLMRQILTELKILNQQFHEMPNILNQANFTMSDPQEYRNDGDFDSSIQ